jgi:hypothetical protein
VAQHFGAWLAAWASAVVARPRLTAAVTLVLTALAGWYAAGNLGVNTDTANMISPTIPWRQHYNEYRDAFPLRDRNLLIVIDAPTRERADEFATELVQELRKQPERYLSPLLAGEGEFFERNGLLYLPTAELAKLTDRLAAAQPLIGLLGDRLDGAAVLDVARQTLTAGGDADAAELAAFYEELARTIGSAADREASKFAWDRLIPTSPGRDPRAGTRRIITLQPAVDFGRMQPAAAAIADVRAIAARLNATGDVRVRLTGTVAMEHEELLSVSRGAGLGALATFILVALVLYASLRSWRLLAASIVTLIVGLSLTAAFAAVTVGKLNLLSIAFVVLNVGLGSDYVIHVLLRYRELIAEGHATNAALVETVRDVGSSLVLCAFTTAAGFYAFIPTTFSGVSELGLIAGTGVFFGLFASITVLPAIVAWWDREPQRLGVAPTWLDPRIFAPLSRKPRLVLAVTTLVLVAAFVALPRVTFDSNPIHLRDPNSESVSTLLDLAASGDAPILNLAAVAPDAATARRWATELREQPEVRAVTTTDALVPDEQDEKLLLLEDLQLLMGSDFGDLERAPADPGAFAAALAALEAASADVPAARALHDATAKWLDGGDAGDYDAALSRLDESLTAGLPRELGRLAGALRAERFDRGDLPAALAQRWLAADGRELVEIAPAENVSDNAAARRFISAAYSVVPTATGLPVVYQEASATVVAAFERALTYAFILVAAIIWLVLRDLKDTLLVLVPIALATMLTAALTVAIGMPFNYANIIALPLLVGMGVDNGIHVVHRMRNEDVARLFDTSTMRAVLASALTTVASFGNLAFSSHRGTASMGILLALGLITSMAVTLIVLPAWLALRAPKNGVAA